VQPQTLCGLCPSPCVFICPIHNVAFLLTHGSVVFNPKHCVACVHILLCLYVQYLMWLSFDSWISCMQPQTLCGLCPYPYASICPILNVAFLLTHGWVVCNRKHCVVCVHLLVCLYVQLIMWLFFWLMDQLHSTPNIVWLVSISLCVYMSNT